ncbi:MAG TPA: hypothetical protein VE553_01950 [Candidatus Binatia bacterium]|jgi:hypothetical protein|nr:hypothetical protein [Candidatus Binatia bacterium]
MSAAPDLTFESDELLKRAQKYGQAITYLAIAFGRKQGVLDAFVDYVGEALARDWESMRGTAVLKLAKAMAADLVALGARVHTLMGDDREAEVVLVGWPDQEVLAFAGISQAEAERIVCWYDAIAKYLGVNFRAQRQGDELTLRIYR